MNTSENIEASSRSSKTDEKMLKVSQIQDVNQDNDIFSRDGTVTYPEDLSDPTNTADYLIITSNYFYTPAKQDFNQGTLHNSLNELAHWRATYDGFDVAVVSVDNIFIGGNNDTKIKNFISYVYQNWYAPHMSDNHVGYILLVGDTPFVTSHLVKYEYEGEALVYAMDSGWYGCINDDYLPEIMIGRFSVDDQTELNVIAKKTIHYEQNYNDVENWHKQVLFCEGEGQNLPPEYETYNNIPFYPFIKNILLDLGGWGTSEAFFEQGGSEAACTTLINDINEGRGIVVYCGHGNSGGWEIFNAHYPRNDYDRLNNGDKLPLVFSLACFTGSFQVSYDCMGEVLLNTPNKGAIAFFGASGVAGVNHFYFAKFLFESLFDNFEYRLGDIINQGIRKLNALFPGYTASIFNLLGDPALDVSGSTGHPTHEKPDLALSHNEISIPLQTPEDQELPISVIIHNIGEGAAENVLVRFIMIDEDDGEQHIIGDQNVQMIPGNSQIEVVQSWDISQELGNKILIVQVDPADAIDEAYELNNQAGTKTAIFQDITYVDDDYTPSTPGWEIDHYNTISAGINAVIDNGTVQVSKGVYYENIAINKPMKLIGENKKTTIIDGRKSTVISINADYSTISGFTLQNTTHIGPSPEPDSSAIKIFSDNNTIIGNNIIKNDNGITLRSGSSYNIISNNILTQNKYGIYVSDSSYNVIFGNTISSSTKYGFDLTSDCSHNLMYHNNLINTQNVLDTGINNIWNLSYPLGGNYWSNYAGSDIYRGASQNILGSDGIGDTPYTISVNKVDHYPLMHRFIPGDMNVDGMVDNFDINPFVLALQNPEGYTRQYHMLPVIHGDCNQDGIASTLDISPFVKLLSGT